MFDVDKIKTGLRGVVGIRQPLDPAYDRFDAAQYLSSSGLFLDDIEHYRTEYYIDSQNFADATDENLQDKWQNLQDSAILNVMSQVFNKPSFIDRNLIFPNAFDRSQTRTISTDPGQFYGYEIKMSDRKNIAFQISRVIIEGVAYAPGGDIVIQLYNSAQSLPIKEKTISLSNTGEQQVFELNWYVNNSDNYYKGQFYIGFYAQNVFQFSPYLREFERANVQSNIQELTIRPIERLGNFADLEDMDYVEDHNGMNFDITVYEDFTDLILQNKFIFAKAIQLQWASSVLAQIISSNRSNRNERIAKEMISLILLTLEGQSGFGLQRVRGLREQMAGELARLQDEIQKIDKGYFLGIIYNDTQC